MTGDATAPALTAEELEQLQSRLVGQMATAGCMPLDVAHGFLTVTAVLPGGGKHETELLDRVLGGLHEDSGLRELLRRLRVQLLRDLRASDYGPLIPQMPRDDGSPLPLPYGWCQGYVAGMDLFGEEQRELVLADAQAAALLAPVLSFLMYEERQWFDPPDEAAHRETTGELGQAAVGLFRWWQGQIDH